MPTRKDIEALAVQTAEKHGIRPDLFLGLIRQESAFNASAKSSAGALGLTQLMPATARGLGLTVDDNQDDRLDPEKNLDAGARYLKQQLETFGGDESLALAAYNAGPGAVSRYGGIPPFKETQNYVKRILSKLPQQEQAPQETVLQELQREFGITPQPIKPQQAGIGEQLGSGLIQGATAGILQSSPTQQGPANLAGTILGSLAPVTAAGVVGGVPGAAATVGLLGAGFEAGEEARELVRGDREAISFPRIALQGLAEGALAPAPLSLGGRLLPRLATGAGLGVVSNVLPELTGELTERGEVTRDLGAQTALSAGLGAGLAALAPGARSTTPRVRTTVESERPIAGLLTGGFDTYTSGQNPGRFVGEGTTTTAVRPEVLLPEPLQLPQTRLAGLLPGTIDRGVGSRPLLPGAFDVYTSGQNIGRFVGEGTTTTPKTNALARVKKLDPESLKTPTPEVEVTKLAEAPKQDAPVYDELTTARIAEIEADFQRFSTETEAKVKSKQFSSEEAARLLSNERRTADRLIRQSVQGDSFEAVSGGLKKNELALKRKKHAQNYKGREVLLRDTKDTGVVTRLKKSGDVEVELANGQKRVVKSDVLEPVKNSERVLVGLDPLSDAKDAIEPPILRQEEAIKGPVEQLEDLGVERLQQTTARDAVTPFNRVEEVMDTKNFLSLDEVRLTDVEGRPSSYLGRELPNTRSVIDSWDAAAQTGETLEFNYYTDKEKANSTRVVTKIVKPFGLTRTANGKLKGIGLSEDGTFKQFLFNDFDGPKPSGFLSMPRPSATKVPNVLIDRDISSLTRLTSAEIESKRQLAQDIALRFPRNKRIQNIAYNLMNDKQTVENFNKVQLENLIKKFQTLSEEEFVRFAEELGC